MGIHILFKAGELLLAGRRLISTRPGSSLPLRRRERRADQGRLTPAAAHGCGRAALALGLGFSAGRGLPRRRFSVRGGCAFLPQACGLPGLPLALLCGLLCLGLRLLLALGGLFCRLLRLGSLLGANCFFSGRRGRLRCADKMGVKLGLGVAALGRGLSLPAGDGGAAASLRQRAGRFSLLLAIDSRFLFLGCFARAESFCTGCAAV